MYDGEYGRWKLKKNDEYGEDVPQRTRRDDGGGDGEHAAALVSRCNAVPMGIESARRGGKDLVEAAVGVVEAVDMFGAVVGDIVTVSPPFLD